MNDSSQAQTQRPFMTTGEIVRLTGVHPNTVAMWRSTKKIIPKDKIGSSFLYDRNDVMAFLAEREKKLEQRKAKKASETLQTPQNPQ